MHIYQYSEIIQNPSDAARGLTRWWWYGCAVERPEIDRELDFMREAGIGGVELQILYPIAADDRATGIRNLAFGSPEFYDILAYTAEACRARGITLDITPGSSWPYGGPFVEDDDAQQEALPYQLDVHGPCEFSCDFTTRFAGTVCAAAMGQMINCVMQPETAVDITRLFAEKELFGWPWGMQLKAIHIPEGDWKLCFFVISMHRNRVGKPGRNAEGRVIDHCSRRAMQLFLKNMVEPIAERVPGIHSYFCDSIEVEGHNWSGVLLDEFRRRRGYDLSKYIYALWGDMGDITPHIRYDYFKTMSELTIENFFTVLADFAHRHGASCRIQAHGTWGDILRVYAAADIPEGETFGDHRALEVNTIHRRLAASSGHVYGKNLISNETFTWLKRPRFTETLEEMKAAVDAVFADGINMIVNHGYAYSPEKAGKRGWPFYASTHINHTTPWWGYYRHLARYIQCVSEMLRRGRPFAEVAVYLPQADVYSDNMLSELHLAMRLEEHLGRAEMDAIQKRGYWFDYINDEALTDLGRIENGALTIQHNRYRAILLVGCTRLPVDTARALAEFAECGGILIAAEQIPDEGCGLMDCPQKAEEVSSLMRRAFAAPNACLVPDRREALLHALSDHLRPDVAISRPEQLGYVHRVDGSDHIYFLTNISDEASVVCCRFRDRHENVRAFDPVSGAVLPVVAKAEWDAGIELSIRFAAHQSVFCVFSEDFDADCPLEAPPVAPDLIELSGWKLRIPERRAEYVLSQPVSWETLPGLEHYSGEGEYSASFELGMVPKQAFLSIEHLSCAATIRVNGAECGDLWTHPYRVDIARALVPGTNRVVICAASTLINEILGGEDNPAIEMPTVLPEWPYYGRVIENQRRARLNYNREHQEQKSLLQCGIWGRVCVEISK